MAGAGLVAGWAAGGRAAARGGCLRDNAKSAALAKLTGLKAARMTKRANEAGHKIARVVDRHDTLPFIGCEAIQPNNKAAAAAKI